MNIFLAPTYSHKLRNTFLINDFPRSHSGLSGGPNRSIYSFVIILANVDTDSSLIGIAHTYRVNRSPTADIFTTYEKLVDTSSKSIETT